MASTTRGFTTIYFQDISAEARLEKMVSLAKTTISAGLEVLKDLSDTYSF